jgi:hypothetical protein
VAGEKFSPFWILLHLTSLVYLASFVISPHEYDVYCVTDVFQKHTKHVFHSLTLSVYTVKPLSVLAQWQPLCWTDMPFYSLYKRFFLRLLPLKVQTSNEFVVKTQSCPYLPLVLLLKKPAVLHIVFYGFLLLPRTRITFNGQTLCPVWCGKLMLRLRRISSFIRTGKHSQEH